MVVAADRDDGLAGYVLAILRIGLSELGSERRSKSSPKAVDTALAFGLRAALPSTGRYFTSKFGLLYIQWAIQGSNL